MWEIYPQGIFELLTRIQRDYHPAQIMVTENGIPVADALDFDGKVRDVRRIQYLQDHLIQVRKAMDAGVPVNGELVWSLMDNFEWAFGYRMRFGIVYIDFDPTLCLLEGRFLSLPSASPTRPSQKYLQHQIYTDFWRI